jgi:hypothetical protein
MLGRLITILVATAVFLSGCMATSGSVRQSEPTVGPAYSTELLEPEQDEARAVALRPNKPRLDVIVPVFEPGLPQDLEKAEEDGIWPELRRAEANLFAYKLKLALEQTGEFGAVRVTPDKSSTGDLYVLGKIKKSNGEEVGIEVEVYDISERKWLKKSFSHTVAESFYNGSRNNGKDPYQPVFTEAADYIVEELRTRDDRELERLKQLTEIRFGASFSEETFSQYLQYGQKPNFMFWSNKGKVSLAGLPSDADPMYQRIKSLRVRDQLFIDRMQSHYEIFNQNVSESYAIWQESSHLELKAIREAKKEAIMQGVIGALLIAGAVYAGSHGDGDNNISMGTVAVTAGIGGGLMLSKSVQTYDQAKFHRETLEELGQSLNLELEPQVVEFEESTAKLTGDANQQFNQWRAFLQKIYETESVPDVQL